MPPRGNTVEQLDDDACELLAVDAEQALWRSHDGGLSWQATGVQKFRRVLTEGLQPPPGVRGSERGVVIAASDSGPGGTAQVMVSDDDGASFSPTPLLGTVLAAQSAMEFTAGLATNHIYLALDPTDASAPPPSATILRGAGAIALLHSDDGGHSFTPVSGAAALRPTSIAINPAAPRELWVNDARGGQRDSRGGLWRSDDGGDTFTQVCCANTAVHDVTIAPSAGGRVSVLAATDGGIRRTTDGGATWTTVTRDPTFSLRSPPDSGGVLLAATQSGVRLVEVPSGRGRVVVTDNTCPGARNIRRTNVVPATFLVDCRSASESRTLRLVLIRYDVDSRGVTGAPASPSPVALPGVPEVTGTLQELARWPLPEANSESGAIAFDGTRLYYDTTQGGLGAIDARIGLPLKTRMQPKGVWTLSFDLRRNLLLANLVTGSLRAYDPASGRLAWEGAVANPAMSYDASFDGLSWVPENGRAELFHTPLFIPRNSKRPADKVCSVQGTPAAPLGVSTWVAAGDGGGYIQLEDDRTLQRVDASCATVKAYTHRAFSESLQENDGLACDTQTFFPQAAVWIRDSVPGTVSAYGIPTGYCPMPSRVIVTTPSSAGRSDAIEVCATLTNATTGLPAAGRPLALEVGRTIVARQATDLSGRMCTSYRGGMRGSAPRPVNVRVSFAGDASLYPSRGTRDVQIAPALPAAATPPLPALPAAATPPLPPLPPPPAPISGPAPLAQIGNAPAPNSAPNPGQAPAGQAQPVAHAAAVPQHEEQPQLVFARAGARLNAANSLDSMSALRRPPPARHAPSPLTYVGALLVLGTTLAAARVAPVRATRSVGGTSR